MESSEDRSVQEGEEKREDRKIEDKTRVLEDRKTKTKRQGTKEKILRQPRKPKQLSADKIQQKRRYKLIENQKIENEKIEVQQTTRRQKVENTVKEKDFSQTRKSRLGQLLDTSIQDVEKLEDRKVQSQKVGQSTRTKATKEEIKFSLIYNLNYLL